MSAWLIFFVCLAGWFAASTVTALLVARMLRWASAQDEVPTGPQSAEPGFRDLGSALTFEPEWKWPS